jgi:hypothetical protein
MSQGGIYRGPGGEELHGDGRPVVSSPFPPPRRFPMPDDAPAAPAAMPQQLTAAQLDELERLLSLATPGIWEAVCHARLTSVRSPGWPPDVVAWPGFDDSDRPLKGHRDNARLIAALRNAAPALIAACRAAGAATPPQQQPECEAQTWEEFIDWYRPATFRDGRPEWSPEIERHMRAAWDHQQKTINALDTISHAKGAELERVASLVGYAGAKPGGLRDAVADALSRVPTLTDADRVEIRYAATLLAGKGLHDRARLLRVVAERFAAAVTPPAPPAEVIHYAARPFTALCGECVPNQRTTQVREHVTCPACAQFLRAGWDAAGAGAATPALTAAAVRDELDHIREFAEAHHGDQPAHRLLYSLTVDIPAICNAAKYRLASAAAATAGGVAAGPQREEPTP